MSSLIVLGANGWLGKSLVDQIKNESLKNYNIKNLILHKFEEKTFADEKENLTFSKIKLINFNGDFKLKSTYKLLEDKLDNFKDDDIYVIVVAGIIHPKKYEYFDIINFHSIKNIYKICEKYKLKKFTYISSNSPFGFNLNKIPFNKNSKYNPTGGYGISKMKAEKFLIAQNKKNIITILRAPWFHGKSMPERQKKFLKSASKGLFPLVNAGKNIRSIINVKDLARAALLVTLEQRKHQIYWICEPNKSMFQILQIIKKGAKKSGKKVNVKHNIYLPIGFSSFFYIIDVILQKFRFYNMYVHVFSEIGQDIFADNSAYMKEFSDKHTFTTLEDSIVEELKEIY